MKRRVRFAMLVGLVLTLCWGIPLFSQAHAQAKKVAPLEGVKFNTAESLADNLKTYMGHTVKFGDNYVGTLCVVYQFDLEPTEEDKEIMGVIASAIGVEEERKSAEEISQIAQFSIDRAGDSFFWLLTPESDSRPTPRLSPLPMAAAVSAGSSPWMAPARPMMPPPPVFGRSKRVTPMACRDRRHRRPS